MVFHSSLTIRPENIEWFVEDQAFSPSYDSAPPHPLPPPLPSASCLSFSVFLCGGREYTGWRGGAGGATKSYDGKKAWSFKNHSILSALDNTACSVFFSSINHKYLSLTMIICFFPTISYHELWLPSPQQPRLFHPSTTFIYTTQLIINDHLFIPTYKPWKVVYSSFPVPTHTPYLSAQTTCLPSPNGQNALIQPFTKATWSS